MAAISPARACKRLSWRLAAEEMRQYDAAGRGRLYNGWNALNQSAQAEDTLARDTMRARGQDLERNSDIANGILHAFERNVVGTGIRLLARVHQTGGGQGGEAAQKPGARRKQLLLDRDLNRKIEALWQEWCKPKNCDYYGDQSFDELCRTMVRRQYVDGGVLIVKAYLPDRKIPFCLQLLEVDEIDSMRMLPKVQGNKVVDGIELTPSGRRAGFWLKKYDLDGRQLGESAFLADKDVIFYWHKTRPSQRREVTRFASSMTRIRDIESLLQAAVIKEKVAACFAVYITRTDPLPGMNFGRSSKALKDPSSGYDGKMVTPGSINTLGPGEDVKPVTPPSQGNDASVFARLMQRLTAASLGLSYESVARDLSGVNYSAARQGLIEDDSTYGTERNNLITHVLEEVYQAFLLSAVLGGAIAISPEAFFADQAHYMRHGWVPPGRRWIDPVKEARADEIAIKNHLKTRAQQAAEQGRNFEEDVEQMAAEQELLQDLGLTQGGKEEANATTKTA